MSDLPIRPLSDACGIPSYTGSIKMRSPTRSECSTVGIQRERRMTGRLLSPPHLEFSLPGGRSKFGDWWPTLGTHTYE